MVGTATVTCNVINRRQADKNGQVYAQATSNDYAQTPQLRQVTPPQKYYEAPYAVQDDPITQLERLGALYTQGSLTD
jgi:hypothetical protein